MKMFLRESNSGIAALEIAMTLPVVLMLIFFMLEMMRVNNTRTSMDTIALELSMDFASTRSTANFATIIAKHKPKAVGVERIKYYFAMYESMEKMCSVAPYGSEEVFWPGNATGYNASQAAYIDSDGSKTFGARNTTTATSGYIALTNITNPRASHTEEQLKGKVFVITVVCDFNFSSEFVKRLFAGGSNTKDGSRFLIWGRAVGICE